MKKTVGVVAGLAAVGLAAFLGTQWAATPAYGQANRPAAPKTKIAILNLQYVILNYQKFKNFQEEKKTQVKSFEDRIQPKIKQLDAYKAEMQKADNTQQEAIKKQATNLQREIQDLTEEARQAIAKKDATQGVIIYQEVGKAVSRFAQANDIELVMHFNDAVTEVDMNSEGNIIQKISNRACIPLYWTQGIDISYPILQMLNQDYGRASAAPATGGAATPR